MQDKFLLCQGKGNTKLLHAGEVRLWHWQCLGRCMSQNTLHRISKTVAKINVYN